MSQASSIRLRVLWSFAIVIAVSAAVFVQASAALAAGSVGVADVSLRLVGMGLEMASAGSSLVPPPGTVASISLGLFGLVVGGRSRDETSA
jgi:hypothetical protein